MMNNLNGNSDYPNSTDDYDYYGTYKVIPICEQETLYLFVSSYIPSVFYLLFSLSLFGNSLILIILAKWEKLKSVTNIFILNLVISDLMFTVSFPFMASNYSSHWIFGEIFCKLIMAFYFFGFQSFVIFITLMTIYQYLTIVHSWPSTARVRVIYALFISILAWGVSIIFSIPEVIIYSTNTMHKDLSEETQCSATAYKDDHTSWWLLIGHYKHFVMFYFVPLVIVIICYIGIAVKMTKCRINRKVKVLKLIFFIALAYFICWSPYNILMFLMFQEETESFTDCQSILHYIFYISQTIVYFHCCINPLLYAFLGTKFRRHLSCSFAQICRQRKTSQQQDLSLRSSLFL